MEAHNYPFLFLLVPILIFGPLLFLILWSFGIKTLFQTTPEIRESRRREKTEQEADHQRRDAAELTLRQTWRHTPLSWLGQAVAYGAFALTIGFFSSHPQYQHTDETNGQIKLSLNHPGHRKAECKQRTAKELADLPPNMRSKMSCERARWPVTVEMIVDGQPIYAETVEPTGLANDGASSFYKVMDLPAGRHRIVAKLSDNGDGQHCDEFEQEIDLAPRQIVVVGFAEEPRGFFVK